MGGTYDGNPLQLGRQAVGSHVEMLIGGLSAVFVENKDILDAVLLRRQLGNVKKIIRDSIELSILFVIYIF